MMTKKLRVVHYINQFYAQFGGEDTAGMGIVVKEEAMGPGLLINKFLGDAGEIVGTAAGTILLQRIWKPLPHRWWKR